MYIDKIIKREALVLVVSVITLLVLIIGISYSLFFSVSEDEASIIKTGDLSLSFCVDTSCNDKYENIGQIIGTSTIDGKTYPKSIYPLSKEEALATTPYIFNIKNTGTLNAYVSIKLIEDTNNELPEAYLSYISANSEYKEHLNIAISNCNDSIDRENVKIINYSDLVDNTILSNQYLTIGEDNTYCLWTYLDLTTPNSVQDSYFIGYIDTESEYIPEN